MIDIGAGSLGLNTCHETQRNYGTQFDLLSHKNLPRIQTETLCDILQSNELTSF